jgi:tetratricopeptide (TPR) repeat protein
VAVHQKLAPLLAETGETVTAIESFQLAARGQIEQGFDDRAIGVYVQAVAYFPDQFGLWEAIAELHLKAGRSADALHTFLDAREALRAPTDRPAAMLCLSRALELEADGPIDKASPRLAHTLDLARLCAREGQRERAEELLDALANDVEPGALRSVRWAQFKLSPTPRNLWRWLFPRPDEG